MIMMKGQFTITEAKSHHIKKRLKILQKYDKKKVRKEIQNNKMRLMNINPKCAYELEDYRSKNKQLYAYR